MADTPKVELPVFVIVPDEPLSADSTAEQEPSQSQERRGSIATSHHARPRPYHIPRYVSQTYPQFKAKQECALKIGIKDLEHQITKSTGVSHLEMEPDKLTVHPKTSQSKLSQQELVDLQKATHFDKKELQQWYKGISYNPPTAGSHILTRVRDQAS